MLASRTTVGGYPSSDRPVTDLKPPSAEKDAPRKFILEADLDCPLCSEPLHHGDCEARQ